MRHDAHNSQQRKVKLPEPSETPRPHPLASEMTEQQFRKTGAERRENHAEAATARGFTPARRTGQRLGVRLFAYALLILGLAIIISLVFFAQWNWGLFFIGLAILFCYMLLISAPFWLASSSKVAQDETAKDVLEEHPERAERAPELHGRNGEPTRRRKPPQHEPVRW